MQRELEGMKTTLKELGAMKAKVEETERALRKLFQEKLEELEAHQEELMDAVGRGVSDCDEERLEEHLCSMVTIVYEMAAALGLDLDKASEEKADEAHETLRSVLLERRHHEQQRYAVYKKLFEKNGPLHERGTSKPVSFLRWREHDRKERWDAYVMAGGIMDRNTWTVEEVALDLKMDRLGMEEGIRGKEPAKEGP